MISGGSIYRAIKTFSQRFMMEASDFHNLHKIAVLLVYNMFSIKFISG